MFTFPPLQLLNPGTHDFSTHIQENRSVSKRFKEHVGPCDYSFLKLLYLQWNEVFGPHASCTFS